MSNPHTTATSRRAVGRTGHFPPLACGSYVLYSMFFCSPHETLFVRGLCDRVYVVDLITEYTTHLSI